MKAIFWLLILIVLFTWAGWFSLGHSIGESRARQQVREERRLILRHAAELAVQGRTQELADWYTAVERDSQK